MKILTYSIWIFVFAISALSSQAATWLGVQDSSGCTWARVKIINDSTSDSSWIISNCRTAVASGQNSAETDSNQDWSGLVSAGTTAYVWIYGVSAGEVSIASAGGTESGYNAVATTDEAGDGEWVITVDAEGTVSGGIVTASYGLPSQSGTMPDMEVEQE